MVVLSVRRARTVRDHDPVAVDLLRLRASVGAHEPDGGRLPPRVRRTLAVATTVGAPVADALDGAAAAEEDARRAARAVAVASAQTRAVAGGLVIAPLLLVPGLGRLVGIDLMAFYSTTVGRLTAAAGGTLLLLGVLLVGRLVRRVGRPPGRRSGWGRTLVAVGAAIAAGVVVHVVAGVVVGLLALRLAGRPPPVVAGVDEAVDLTATSLAGGVAPSEALRTAADHLPELAPPLRRLALDLELGLDARPADPPLPGVSGRGGAAGTRRVDPERDPFDRLRSVLVASVDVGAPVVPTLRRLARDLRAEDLARVLAAAERLPAQLTFPTALCLLPATLLLIGAPIVHAGLAAAGT